MINNLENILAGLAKKAYIKPEVVTPLSVFTADLSAEATIMDDTVHVVKIAAGTAKEKQEGAAYSPDAAASTVPVQLTKRFYSAANVTDITFSRMSDQMRADLFAGSAVKLGKKMNAAVNELVAAQTKTAEFTPSFAGVAAAKAEATKAGVEGELIMCLAPETYDALVADPDVAKIAAIGGNNDVFAKGEIAQLHGVKVVRLPAAPAGTIGYLTQKSAIAIASRTTPLPDTQAGTIISDDKTGLAFSHKFIEDADTAAVKVVTEILFGAAIVDDSVIVKLTAKTA